MAAMFDGDESAFDAVNARDLMAQNRYPQLSGVFVAGEDDDIYRPQQEIMFEAARAADMNVDYYTLPGGTRVMCGALLWNSKWTGWAGHSH